MTSQLKWMRVGQHGVAPRRGTPGSAGLDLTATWHRTTRYYEEYGTGIAFEIPEGHVGLLFQRSSVRDRGLSLCNAVGVLDSDYRGEVTFSFRRFDGELFYKIGERVGQLLVVPIAVLDPVEVDELSTTQRGTGGHGSTGR